jgi:hypothetical protein
MRGLFIRDIMAQVKRMKCDREKERWGVHSRDPLCIGEENVIVRGWRLRITEYHARGNNAAFLD